MKLRVLTAIILATFVLSVCAIAAQPRLRAARMAHRMGIVRVLIQLNLSDSQRAEIEAIVKDARVSARAIKQDTSLARDAKRAQLKQLRQQTVGKVKGLLTPEQLQKLEDLKAKHRVRTGLKPA